MKIGSINVTRLFLGDTEITKCYIGGIEILIEQTEAQLLLAGCINLNID